MRTCTARFALVLLTLAAVAGCRTGDGTRVIKLAHGLDVSHPVHVAVVDMAERLMEASGGRMAVFSIPYVLRNNEHLRRVLDGEIGHDLLMAGERYHLRGLCYYDAGPRQYRSTH
ncbi:MAG: hypothetical protein GTN78_07750 [Gemmatimonadales bacterium]|nr:hypothetical protein [Gemmatimonadales bacterium]NIR00084.1 hypothetical protein [Gemmatimonadales bacterium]